MWNKLVFTAIVLSFLGLLVQRVLYYSTAIPEKHEHPPGEHAGSVISLGDDQYHVEAVFTSEGLLMLYPLDRDGSRTLEVEERLLTAFLTPKGSTETHEVALQPAPQAGDRTGKTSCFCGTLPAELMGRSVQVSVPNFQIGNERFHLHFSRHSAGQEEMPAPVAEAEERALHLVPGGMYSGEDIEANGRTIPSQRYRGFQARHDHDPRPGDQLCPVTRTKANPECSWIVGGRVYRFCCPPCIDEFVRLAKEQPQNTKPPEAYVQQ